MLDFMYILVSEMFILYYATAYSYVKIDCSCAIRLIIVYKLYISND